MSKALVIIKSAGMGDLTILIANIHAISKLIEKPVVVLAQKSTQAKAILKYDPHVEKIIELDKKGFFNIIKKIKIENFNQSYIYSDSLRIYLISKLSGIKNNYHYKFFSKKNKNFFRTAKEFTEHIVGKQINCESKIFCDNDLIEKSKSKFNISNKTKNIVCGISASGPTKRWDVENYIKLFKKIGEKFSCKFFIAAGPKDEDLVCKIKNSSIGKECISFSKMSIEDAIPIISSCQYYIGNDTGWGQISAALNIKSLFLFCDSPPAAYGLWRNNISIIVPIGKTINTCGHNTRGKNNISFDEVYNKTLEMLT